MVISEPTAPVPSRYRLIEEVGQGGMAVVYRAKDDTLKRDVAIKVLHRHLSDERESKLRLEREAQAVAKLRHDNILEIYDYSGGDADSAYIVTEFIDGQTLKQFLADRSIRHPEIAALIAAELGGALAHAHGVGVIHRDIKPENVMIRKDGMLKLMDFGIAQVLDLERMTVTGQLLGSPAYMAPELVEGKPLDVRTDVFSVGILLYQMATGALPFSGKNPHEVLRRITEGRFPDPRGLNPLISAGLARIMTRALARQPSGRYDTMAAMVVELTAELTEAGLGQPREELADYFADPAAYEKALPARMTPALTATAEKHMSEHNAAHAMECWNRVLAYAPDDPVVTAALKRWEDRGRRRRLARMGIGAAALAGMAVAAAELVAHQSHVDPKTPGPGANATMGSGAKPNAAPPVPPGNSSPAGATVGMNTNAAGPQGSRAVLEEDARAPRLIHLRPPGERVPLPGRRPADPGAGAVPGEAPPAPPPSAPPPVETRTFTLGPTPQNVDVYLDGERQFAYDTDHRTLTVSWNASHLVEFRSPSGCCFVERIEIGPDKRVPSENIIARKLKWKPARLTVTTSPADANVRIMVRDPAHPERGTVLRPGEEANIPFTDDDQAQKEVELSVATNSGVNVQRVMVRAGERKTAGISLTGAGGPHNP